MKQHYPCETCKFRAQYDKNPKSLIGRFWRWHIGFCPGWKAFFTHQPEETKAELREKYGFTILENGNSSTKTAIILDEPGKNGDSSK